jgi:hypothetical protein
VGLRSIESWRVVARRGSLRSRSSRVRSVNSRITDSGMRISDRPRGHREASRIVSWLFVPSKNTPDAPARTVLVAILGPRTPEKRARKQRRRVHAGAAGAKTAQTRHLFAHRVTAMGRGGCTSVSLLAAWMNDEGCEAHLALRLHTLTRACRDASMSQPTRPSPSPFTQHRWP